MQQGKLLNKYKHGIPQGAVYIGRGSIWGNPFLIGKDGDRDRVCDKYAEHLRNQLRCGKVSLDQLSKLHGKDLVCFCSPLRCHGNTLLTAAEWAFNKTSV